MKSTFWMTAQETEKELESRMVRYLGNHALPAAGNGNGTVTTVNEYVDRKGIFHSEPITLAASYSTVRNFLGY